MQEAGTLPMHPAIPRVLCPRCASTMRLAEVTSEEDRERMKFDCACGFEYQMSSRVQSERRPQQAVG